MGRLSIRIAADPRPSLDVLTTSRAIAPGMAVALAPGMVVSSWNRVAAALLVTVVVGGCAAAGTDEADGEESGESRASSLTSSQRRERAQHLRDVTAARGIQKGWLIAGIGNAETGLAHCWSELTWACKGPVSADCGGGPVVSGAADGPCSIKQGGLGMFQFDAGTHSQTLAKYGKDVLTVDGNIDDAINYVIDMVIDSKYVSGVTNEAEAIAWMNGITVGSAAYKTWIKTVTHYYNGCVPGSCSVYNQRYSHYDQSTRAIHDEVGAGFWKPTKPIEVYWARQESGEYSLRALAPTEVVKVKYLVDDYLIAEATRDDPATAEVENNFPDAYTFKYEVAERLFEVEGYDKSGSRVARGIGLIDSVPGTAVYIKQMGEKLYEIGLERAPEEVAAIEVRADGVLLTDSETGEAHSPRNAVRYTFSKLGERSFEIDTFNADGTLRGTLHREFRLE